MLFQVSQLSYKTNQRDIKLGVLSSVPLGVGAEALSREGSVQGSEMLGHPVGRGSRAAATHMELSQGGWNRRHLFGHINQ